MTYFKRAYIAFDAVCWPDNLDVAPETLFGRSVPLALSATLSPLIERLTIEAIATVLEARHLYVALSGHGFGHLAQVAPVVNAWQRRHPERRLTIQTALPETVVRTRIPGVSAVVTGEADFGLRMADALTVQIDASLTAYRAFHADWERRLAWQIDRLRTAAPDLILADIPYLTLAAAARFDISARSHLCSLNWADVLAAYAPDAPDLDSLARPMLEAYNSAAAFLCPEPSMPMPALRNAHPIGPIGVLGRSQRPRIDHRLGLRANETLVLIGLSGLEMRLSLTHWPRLPGVHWLTPPGTDAQRDDVHDWTALGALPMVDLIASCDAFLTKPGYGAFVEAACHGTPVLYVERDDWPEEPGLNRWLHTHGRAQRLSRAQFDQGDLADPLHAVLGLGATGFADQTDRRRRSGGDGWSAWRPR
ncbi:MAG: hypothetical protein MZV65_32690 [Chromatiales bacterium]|nr:hypothetical protein [Chromatiales bacterium]